MVNVFWLLIELVLFLGAALGVYWWLLRPNLLASAKREADLHIMQFELKAKEETLALRERTEDELRQRRQQLDAQENRLSLREETLVAERARLEAELSHLDELRSEAKSLHEAAAAKVAEADLELSRISGLTPEDAKTIYLDRAETEYRDAAIEKAKRFEAELMDEAERRARSVVLDVIQRSGVETITEATTAVVELPSEDMKGRIIGREGRNIRAFEQVTGVDLIIDDTPQAVVISSFDPVRRETARLALMNLMMDGRIQPSRIEEHHEKAQEEVERMISDAGERAMERAGVAVLPHQVMSMLGKLRFRHSYGQNVLDHSVEVARMAGLFAHELGFDVEAVKRAGLLHDIGKALGPEFEGPHALTGMEYLSQCGESPLILNAVGAHHYDIEPDSPEAMLVIIADSMSAARPGARRESLETYIKRLAALEALANSFEGVDRSYAVQAGREVRLLVKPEQVDDVAAVRLAGDVARRIEAEMEYPGQIKVTVIRETRATELAR